MKFRTWTLAAVAAPAAFVLTGYTIKPGDNIHERMTMAAKRCFDLAAASTQKPATCDANISKDLPAPDLKWLTAFEDVPQLDEAVRWPDDPQRELALPTAIKVLQRLGKCKSRAEKEGSQVIDINKKLLCNSNFGAMQFFHAQASAVGEPAPDTHFKVMHWAEFLYNVASVYTDAELDKSYCTFFSQRHDAFNEAMLPDHSAIPCGDEKHPGWAINTLFNMHCKNILTSKRCKIDKDPERYDRARMRATGAILHMIQDSYSQSHCVRGQCEVVEGKVAAKVECQPIQMFTTYVHQENHGDADRDPVFAASCGTPGATDDPVIAGAKVLWHIRNHSPVALFRADMEKVFGTTAQAAALPPAGLGDCFKQKL